VTVRSGVDVGAGATTTSTLAIGSVEGATEIRVSDSATGATYLRVPIEVDCDEPARPTATSVLDCAAGVLVVVLGNDAGDPADLMVVHERVEVVAEVVLDAGSTIQVEVPLGDAEVIPIRVVDGDGNDVIRVSVDNICPPTDGPSDDDGGDDQGGGAEDGTGIDAAPGSCATSVREAPECADVRIVVEPDCPRSLADVSVRREGIGRERFVVLLDGTVAGVIAIEGTGDRTIPVSLGRDDAVLTVSRSTSTEAIVVGTLSCDAGSSRAGPIAASLVVFAVLSTAAGVMPWPPKVVAV
jgi:hypothetical protein